MADKRILLGRVLGAHGVRGLVRLTSFTAEPEAIARYETLTDDQGCRRRIRLRGRVKDGLLAALEGIEDRAAAEALKGLGLYVERSALPQPADDEYYLADLIGLVARDPQGRGLGRIVAVPNHGAGDLLELAPRAGGPTLLLPFDKATVPRLAIAEGWLEIVLPPEQAEDREPT
ncbi:MAG: 16S rRNA processing protein RimM [Alphaproteobacteria bacterium]|nr:16S rRNA processing protein RimM [Alphaproteobacteria bacterium]